MGEHTMPKTPKPKAPARAMPEWKKPDPALVERFHAALPAHPEAQPKKMFGYPACFVNGNFFVGMHNDNFVIRLPGDLKAKFPELARAEGFDPMGTGKSMKDWWIIPPALARSQGRLAAFFASAFDEVRRLPPKVKKTKAAGKKAPRPSR
jgi:hypothetical protein